MVVQGLKWNKQNVKKIIPNNLEKLLTVRSLAVWWADDGSYGQHDKTIHTQSFSLKELVMMKTILKNKFKVDVNIRKLKRKQQWIIVIPAKSKNKFFSLIKPILSKISSLQYKLPQSN